MPRGIRAAEREGIQELVRDFPAAGAEPELPVGHVLAVEIGTAGDHHSQGPCKLLEPVAELHGVVRMPRFDPCHALVPAGTDEDAKGRTLEREGSGVGDDGNPARPPDQRGGVAKLEACARLVVRHSLSDETFERRVDGPDDFLLHEDPGKVRPADDFSARDVHDFLQGDGDSRGLHLFHHPRIAPAPRLLDHCQGFQQGIGPPVDPDTQEVELTLGPLIEQDLNEVRQSFGPAG